MIDDILEAWWTNHRINERVLDAISKEGLASTLSTRGGRSVTRQFAHIHTNRIWHLQKRGKKLAIAAKLFETSDEPSRAVLKKTLRDSSERMANFFGLIDEGATGVKCMKRGLTQYLSYFVCHEAHHRGNILLTLKQSGHAIDAKVRSGIWDWDRI